MNTRKIFFKYVSFNMLSAIGMSCYCLADSIFIATGVGVNGLAALNLVMPIYNIIFAVGLLLGVGGATQYSILKAQNQHRQASIYYSYAVVIGILFSIPIMFIGFFNADPIVSLLGADNTILPTASIYLKSFILFTPFFIFSQIITAFIRNDNNPRLASIASFTGTIFNIVFDYILVFPCHLGMMGAALATGFSPIVTLLICSMHFFQKKNQFHFIKPQFIFNDIIKLTKIGLPSFITELSSGIVIFAFNDVILSLSNHVAIASYGILSNLAIFIIGFYNGISQGIQPLLSHSYGTNDHHKIKEYLKLAMITSLCISLVMIISMIIFPNQIVSLFNSEENQMMANIAVNALPIYFSAFFFIGVNLIFVSYFASTRQVTPSAIISILRGGVIVIPLLILLAKIFDMTGVWLSYPISEIIIMIIALIFYKKHKFINL